jgi:3-phytase
LKTRPNPPSNSTVSITAIDANAVEAGNDSGSFRITRTGDTNTALAIKYTVSGTANNGNDYDQITGIAGLTVGESFVDISINPVANDFTEGDETVTVALATDDDYDIDTSQATATVTIFDQLNVINGNGSRDPLIGTAGNDRIIGGTGSKTIAGGAGCDEFVYTSLREVGHRITDFTVGEDKIVVTQLLDSLVSDGYNSSDAISE